MVSIPVMIIESRNFKRESNLICIFWPTQNVYIKLTVIFQYALHSKKENAHEESIWTCAWGRLSLSDEGAEKENENNGNVTNKGDDGSTVDIIATGGVDDLVKVWEYTSDGEMKLKHKLADHSLGVVSVDLSKDVKRKFKKWKQIL